MPLTPQKVRLGGCPSALGPGFVHTKRVAALGLAAASLPGGSMWGRLCWSWIGLI